MAYFLVVGYIFSLAPEKDTVMAGRIGQQLGNYRLIRLLGRGGFAEVYLGEQVYLQTQAALKVLHIHLPDKSAQNFLNEARMIAHLQHPRIVPILDFAVQEGTPFLVMHYAPEGSVRAHHPKGTRLPANTIRSYIKDVASALQFAHDQQVIHRDVKPENMLLGQHQAILLSDFGVAITLQSPSQQGPLNIAGTPTYAAPEQLQGHPCKASDQYALAAVVYEWLCGTPPFSGSLYEIAVLHMRQAPLPLRLLVPHLSPLVEQVVLTALAKDPKQRFASVMEFAQRLEEAMSAEEGGSQTLPVGLGLPLSHASFPGARAQAHPLIGREEERRQLQSLLLETEQCLQAPVAHRAVSSALPWTLPARTPCILLQGEAGMGKTRLAEEVSTDALQRGWIVLWSRAYEQERHLVYGLWTEMLRRALQQGIWQPQKKMLHPHLSHALSLLLPELADLHPSPAVPMSSSSLQDPFRLWEATLTTLTTFTDDRPTLVVLDDLHWADRSSCELLCYLIRHLTGYPLLLVGTYREPDLTPTHPLCTAITALQREQLVSIVPVLALTDAQISQLIGELVPEQDISQIQRQAAGNPFFAEELARASLQGPVLSNTRTSSSQKHSLPEKIVIVFDQRLKALSPTCRKLLQHAAVLGSSFSLALLQWMDEEGLTPGNQEQTLTLAEEALDAGILVEEGVGHGIIYHFWHPLLRSYLYETLSASRRALLHQRAAGALQQLYAKREEEGAVLIVHHLLNGGADDYQVAHYAELAGHRAYSLSSYPEAESHYRIALEHLHPDDAETLDEGTLSPEQLRQTDLLERLGECTRIQGKFEEARQFYQRTLELRQQQRILQSSREYQQEAQIQALLWCEIGLTWYYVGKSTQARQCYMHAEHVLQKAEVVAGPAWAYIRYLQSYVYGREGAYEEARRMALEVLSFFEEVNSQLNTANTSHLTHIGRVLAGDPVNLGRTYRLLAAVAAGDGHGGDALRYLTTALAVFEQNDIQGEIAIVSCSIGDVYLRNAEHHLAKSFFRRSLSIAERISDVFTVYVTLGNLGVLATRLGNLVEAEDWFQRGILLAEQANDAMYVSVLYAYLANALREQGRLSEARKNLYHGLKTALSMHIEPCIGLCLVALGYLRISQVIVTELDTRNVDGGRHEKGLHLYQAKKVIEKALALKGIEAETRTEGELALAQVLLLQGDLDQALTVAIQTLEDARQFELTWLIASTQRLLGCILATQGKHEEADKHSEQAICTFRKAGMRLECACTLLAYGQLLLRQNNEGGTQYQRGMGYLQEAHQMFIACQANLYVRLVECALRELSISRTDATFISKRE